MYKIGGTVKTEFGIGVVKDKYENLNNHFVIKIRDANLIMHVNEMEHYKTAHDKLIEMGYVDKGYVIDTRRYEAYNMWVIFNVTNKTYTINKLVGIAAICPDIDLTLSRILTQYLEELEEMK